MTVKIKRVQSSTTAHTTTFASGSAPQMTSIRQLRLNQGLPTLGEMRSEIDQYVAVLLGHEEPPIENGVMTLLEYANAVYSRAAELTLLIQRAEADGVVPKNSKMYRFRTGELRTFIEIATKAVDLGSRRITAAQMEYSMLHG